jgi:hypothetical protein
MPAILHSLPAELPNPAVIIGPFRIADMTCITKWAVSGVGNFSYRRGKNGRKAEGTIRKTFNQKVLIYSREVEFSGLR